MEFSVVTGFNCKQGGTTIDLIVDLLRGIDNAARNGNADFGLIVTVSYIDTNGLPRTARPPRRSIKYDTTKLADIDGRTVASARRSRWGM
jgi:hypothetical protein